MTSTNLIKNKLESCRLAAAEGRINSLIEFEENKFPWDERTCSSTAKNGRLDCLKYLVEI